MAILIVGPEPEKGGVNGRKKIHPRNLLRLPLDNPLAQKAIHLNLNSQRDVSSARDCLLITFILHHGHWAGYNMLLVAQHWPRLFSGELSCSNEARSGLCCWF
jgi:hypothetical protein